MISGALAGRMHQALRLSFPISRARQALIQLVVVYIVLGHSRDDITRMLVKLQDRYTNVFRCTFKSKIFGPCGLVSCRALLKLERELSDSQ